MQMYEFIKKSARLLEIELILEITRRLFFFSWQISSLLDPQQQKCLTNFFIVLLVSSLEVVNYCNCYKSLPIMERLSSLFIFALHNLALYFFFFPGQNSKCQFCLTVEIFAIGTRAFSI